MNQCYKKKDRLNRRANNVDEAGFTDDGFPLGCAFLLRVLHLYDAFDAFHWWEEVQTYLTNQRQSLDKQKRNANNIDAEGSTNDFDDDTWNLSSKRCNNMKNEWRLLFFSFQASRIFFRFDDKEIDAKKKEMQEQKERKEDMLSNNKSNDNNNNNNSTPGGPTPSTPNNLNNNNSNDGNNAPEMTVQPPNIPEQTVPPRGNFSDPFNE